MTMPKFVSLEPAGLSDAFDAEVHGEQPVVTVKEKEDTVEVSYVFPGFTMADDDREVEGESMPFKEVGISGAGFVSESGKPLLPSFGRFVQIPPGCDFDLRVKKSKAVEFEDLLITPAQEKAADGSEEGEFEFDRESYSEETLYPEKIVEVNGPYELDDYTVLALHVRPLQYQSAKRRLRGFSNITVTIKLASREETDAEDSDASAWRDPELEREGFGNLVVNPGRRILERLPELKPPGGVIRPILPRGPELLIIYAKQLKQPAEKLAQWKNMRGLLTEAVPIRTVANTVAKLKQYIRKRRERFGSRLRYVLLFGDVHDIVTEEIGGNTTDYYFFTRIDPSGASECLLPWVSGGRIPVNAEAEGMAVVDQIIRYEKQPPCDPEYYRRMSFAAYFQDDRPQDGKADRAYIKTMEGIRSHMVTQGFDVERVYVSNNPNPQRYKDGTLVPAEVKDAIIDAETATDMLISETSEGQLLIGHRDHGGPSGWMAPELRTSHLAGIVSQYPSIFYSVNCSTGSFNIDPHVCFAEAILALDGGAPSLIAATEGSGTWRNDSMMKALFDAMWPGVIPTFPGTTMSYPVKYNRLGDILNYAKSYLLVAHGANSGVRDHFEIYHVIGDPTLQLWADEPLLVRLLARVYIRRDLVFVMMSACPTGSVVTLWHQGKLVARVEPRSPRFAIPLRDLKLLAPSGQRRHILTLCFSAPGYRFVRTSVRC